MKRTFLPWTTTQHQRLYRACNTPNFREHLLKNMGISETTLNHWLLSCDVPQTKRTAVRLLVEAWETSNNQPA